MRILEIACALIVLTYVAVRLLRRSEGAGADTAAAFLHRFVWLVVASAVGENSMIRLYGFYHYAPGWSLFIDQVPLLIVLIWPVVIDSAAILARGLAQLSSRPPTRLQIALVGGAVVWVDAWLIEPIATQSGLWCWHAPGLFGVPPIGVLGWAIFAALALYALPRLGEDRQKPAHRLGARLLRAVLTAVGVLLCTHALLIAAWWLLLRWLSASLPVAWGIAVAWGTLLPAAVALLLRRAGRFIALPDLLVRVPAAAFFFVLLAQRRSALGPQLFPLLIYALAFALPYWALVFVRRTAGPASPAHPLPPAVRGTPRP